MNCIDKKVNNLLKEINLFSKEEIESHIWEKFKVLSLDLQERINVFLAQFSFWGTYDSEKENTITKVAHFLKTNVGKLEEFYDSLEDYRSKKIFYAVINNWYNYDFVSLEEVMEKTFTHYFDLDILPNCQKEIFVDVGAYTGDTIKDFIDTYGPNSYQKIYAFEMTEESMNTLKENVKDIPRIIYKQKGVLDKNGKGTIAPNEVSSSSNRLMPSLEEDIEITTLDEEIKEKVTLIKMDIEGSEAKAIIGSTRHIEEETPNLILSIYHGFDDFLKIWDSIRKINTKYKYYLRYYGGPIFPTEIVLYAINE